MRKSKAAQQPGNWRLPGRSGVNVTSYRWDCEVCHFAEVLSLRELSLLINSLLLRYEMRSAARPWACWERGSTWGLDWSRCRLGGGGYFVSYTPKRQRRRKELMGDLKTWALFPAFSRIQVAWLMRMWESLGWKRELSRNSNLPGPQGQIKILGGLWRPGVSPSFLGPEAYLTCRNPF